MRLANLRGLGGIENTEGKKVKYQRLLRSGEIYQIDDKSKQKLEEYQLVKIIDLRGENEIAKHPDDELPNVNYHWIDIMKEVHDNGSLADLTHIEAEVVNQHMLSIYNNLVMNPGAQEGYQEYFEELLKTEHGSVLFHCFAGKDRTGIAAALTLELLDVPKELIYQDYLETNVQRQKPNEALFDQLRGQGMDENQLEGFRVAMEVRPAYLDRAYELLEKNYGGVQGYAKGALNLSESDMKDLKKLYLD